MVTAENHDWGGGIRHVVHSNFLVGVTRPPPPPVAMPLLDMFEIAEIGGI